MRYLLALLMLLLPMQAGAGELVSTHAERESLGGGKHRMTISSAPIAYEENGTLKRIDPTFANNGVSPYPYAVDTAKLKVKVGLDGSRKFIPTADPEKYMILGRPYTLNASLQWVPVDFGEPVRSGNKLTWTKTAGIVTITHMGHGVKHEIELLGGYVPRQSKFAYPLTLNGLTRQGTQLLDGSVVVANLRKPVVYDAANPTDIRNITYSFENLNGTIPAVISTLPDLTGMTRPVVDPTVTLQPNGTGIDTYIRTGAADSNYGAATTIGIGEDNGAADVRRYLIKFDLSTIPSSATVKSATLQIYATADAATNARTQYVYRMKQAWVEGTKLGGAGPDGATYNTYNGTDAWLGGGGGFGVSDCEQVEIGSRAFLANDGINVFKSWTLTASAVQEWVSGTFTNNGMMVKTDTETDDGYNYVSSDGATASQRPILTVEYMTSGGAILFTAP